MGFLVDSAAKVTVTITDTQSLTSHLNSHRAASLGMAVTISNMFLIDLLSAFLNWNIRSLALFT
jgi:hypothetical protein